MNDTLKVIVNELNKKPFEKNFSVISFDSLNGEQLLQQLSDVLAVIGQAAGSDVGSEPADVTVARLSAFLHMLKYQPTSDLSMFRQGLVTGDKSVVYPVLHWCLLRIPELSKRAYLARFLVKLDLPAEFLAEQEMSVVFRQYEDLIEEFKNAHKQLELQKNSAVQTTELRRDIAAMEEEKEVLSKKIARLKNKAGPTDGERLRLARRQRVETQRRDQLASQRREQLVALSRAEQLLQRRRQLLHEARAATGNTSMQGLVARCREDVEVSRLLACDKMPQQLNNVRCQCDVMQKVLNVPALSSHELLQIKNKVSSLRDQVNSLQQRRDVMYGSCSDAGASSSSAAAALAADQLIMFRRQARALADNKTAAASSLTALQQQLHQLQPALSERRDIVQYPHGDDNTADIDDVSGEEFQRYVQQLRDKSLVYKNRRQRVAALQSQLATLTDKQRVVTQQLNESQQCPDWSVSQAGSSTSTGPTDWPALCVELNERANLCKTRLSPLIKELRLVRPQYQQLSSEHAQASSARDSLAAGLQANTATLHHEVSAVWRQTQSHASRVHVLAITRQLLLCQRVQLGQTAPADGASAAGSFSLQQQLQKLLSVADARAKQLRAEQKQLTDSSADSAHQLNMWSSLLRLMTVKAQYIATAGVSHNGGVLLRGDTGERLEL